MNAIHYPIVRLTLFFVFGIVFTHFLKIPINFLFATAIVLITIAAILFIKFKSSKVANTLFAILVFLSVFNLGCLTDQIANPKNHSTNYSNLLQDKHTNLQVTLEFTEQLKNGKKHQRFYANLLSVSGRKVSGKILVKIPLDSIAKNVNLGIIYKAKANYRLLTKTNNPDQFDYSNYLEGKYIYGNLYAVSKSLSIENSESKSLLYYAYFVRNKIIKNLSNSTLGKEELAVFSALILGQKQDVSSELIKDYQYAGAIHILSVSGLHVGILLIFINFFLNKLPNTNSFRICKLVTTLLLLWTFGLIAGLSPSILRSVTMFSFIALGAYFNQEKNIYSVLAISVFCLLLIKPNYLFDVGFQLSYSAVYGIVFITPVFTNWYNPKNRIARNAWQILAVSFAAQLATLPICLYYFHQTTALFFITNLAILPFLGLLLGLGFITAIFAFFDFSLEIVTSLLHYSLYALNYTVHFVAGFEKLVFTNVTFTLSMAVCIYVLIFLWIRYLKMPNFNRLILGLISVLILQITIVISDTNRDSLNQFIVFSKIKDSEFLLRKGQNVSCFLSDTENKNLRDKSMFLNYVVQNKCKVAEVKKISNFYFHNNVKIFVLDEKAIVSLPFNPDVVIIRNSSKVNLDRFLLDNNPKIIVADASNYKSYVLNWSKSCAKKNIPFHSTYEKGYFSL